MRSFNEHKTKASGNCFEQLKIQLEWKMEWF